MVWSVARSAAMTMGLTVVCRTVESRVPGRGIVLRYDVGAAAEGTAGDVCLGPPTP